MPRSPVDRHAAAVEIALHMTPAARRSALATLFALDARFADIVFTTSEQTIGRIRLAWWRDALFALDTGPAPAEPLLRRIEALLLPMGIAGSSLAALTEGWDALLSGAVPDLADYAEPSGAMLFAMAADLLEGGGGDGIAAAGRGWALTRIPRVRPDQVFGSRAKVMAHGEFDAAFNRYWPLASRPLGALALLIESDLNASSSRIRDLARLIRFRSIGR